jgi:hypothetical protein
LVRYQLLRWALMALSLSFELRYRFSRKLPANSALVGERDDMKIPRKYQEKRLHEPISVPEGAGSLGMPGWKMQNL